MFFKSFVLEQKTNKPIMISNCMYINAHGLSSYSVNKVHIYENERRNGESTMTSYINTYWFFIRQFCWADDRLNIPRWHCRRLIWNWVFQWWHTFTCTNTYTIKERFTEIIDLSRPLGYYISWCNHTLSDLFTNWAGFFLYVKVHRNTWRILLNTAYI